MFKKYKKVVFIKDSNSLQDEYNYLIDLNDKKYTKKINLLKEKILYETVINKELYDSCDMYVLHDINLNYAGLNAIIDYVIITRNNIFIVYLKNNVDIYNKKILNDDVDRELIKLILCENYRVVDRILFEIKFKEYCHKAFIDDKDNDSIKPSELIKYINDIDKKTKNKFSSSKMNNIALNILNKHVPLFIDYDILYKRCE